MMQHRRRVPPESRLGHSTVEYAVDVALAARSNAWPCSITIPCVMMRPLIAWLTLAASVWQHVAVPWRSLLPPRDRWLSCPR